LRHEARNVSFAVMESIVQRRAVEAVNWGIPAVNYDRMVQAMHAANAAFNQIVYWSHLPDWRNQLLTPNPDVIYVIPFIDTRGEGPMVLEIPPAGEGIIAGNINDGWQNALEDVGPAGADRGKGGKYLILQPDSPDKVPFGYIPLRSSYFQNYAVLRSLLKSGSHADFLKAIEHAKRIQLYPLSRAARPPPTTFVDAADVVFDATIPYDLRFFQSLDRMIQYEPWNRRDKVMIDMLRSLGIVKGRPFNPDAKMQNVLEIAAREAHGLIEERFDTAFPPYYDNRQWAVLAPFEIMDTMDTLFETHDAYPIDERGLVYSYAFSSAKHLGAGQFYFWSLKDRRGRFFDGSKSYRLAMPAKVPASQSWSAVVYDRATHTFIRDLERPGRSSLTPGLQANADGSVDLWFGPRAPFGKEPNWVPTAPHGQFEVCVRFYGPGRALFDKSWKLPDLEEVTQNEKRAPVSSSFASR
jgi:hypothetical protein